MSPEELDLKKQELELRKKEIENSIKVSQKRSKESLSVIIGVIIAIIGLFGNIANNLIQGNHQEKLEKQKFEAELIKWSLESKDMETNRANLKFLLDGGLISDEKGSIKQMVNDTTILIPTKTRTKCVFISAYNREGKLINSREKCSDDEKYLSDYISGFTKASNEQGRTVKTEWISE
jgi:hypothetical protein